VTSIIGTHVGGYQILSHIGAGGMGEVYLARDTKLGRNVAVKVLPSSFANDPDRLARFGREARLLAALNHPNIATIHGIEEADGVHGLVMELVEGPTLSDKLTDHAQRSTTAGLPLAEALRIGGQIAEALEAAHEKGVIHRDLKPANIKLTRDGHVKILDFGLAKSSSTDGSGGEASDLPTVMTSHADGEIIGTPAYMSPEQVRGLAVDKRTDIWGFGCVLYEMLTGRRAFAGGTSSDAIAAILEREPDWSALPGQTPTRIQRLLRRCLEKDSKRRLRDIGDARLEMLDVGGDERVAPPPSAVQRSRRLLSAAALGLLTAVAAALGVAMLRPAPVPPEARLEINTPSTRDPSLAISPDGLKIVFATRDVGQAQLWLRSLDSSSLRRLPGTERGTAPFWSPDGRSIGFFADNQLKRLDIDGGSITTVMSTIPAPGGGTWAADGTILVSVSPGQPLFRIALQSGEHSAATRFGMLRERTHSQPRFLPDGRHFLFYVSGSAETTGVYIGQLDNLDSRRLLGADSAAVYTATEHLLFVRDERLLEQRFDTERLELLGEPFPIVEHVGGGIALSAAAAGPVIYRTVSRDSGQRQLLWVDRSGKETQRVVYPDTQSLAPSLSRDGRRVAVFRLAMGNTDIWSYDIGRRAWDRLTVHPGDEIHPLWSPDGSRVIFGARRGQMDLYSKDLNSPAGSGEELLLATNGPKFPMDWSRDGRVLLYNSMDPKLGLDIWALPLDGERKPRAVVQTEFNEQLPQLSPDGKWMVYQSNRTGRFEVYIRPFPGPGSDAPVSAEGGAQARWNPDGKELFYIAADDRLMSVPMRFSANGDGVVAGTPQPLFVTNVGSTAPNTNRQQYAVSPDGQSFILNSQPDAAQTSPITVILNWRPER
jgi:serine/threonine protein kinase